MKLREMNETVFAQEGELFVLHKFPKHYSN